MNGVEASGACKNCSTFRPVFHGTPWCPHIPAVAIFDSNGPSPGETAALSVHVSRPVEVGELVLLVDQGDGEDRPFATWGQVIEVGHAITFKMVAEVGIANGCCYADPSQYAALEPGDPGPIGTVRMTWRGWEPVPPNAAEIAKLSDNG